MTMAAEKVVSVGQTFGPMGSLFPAPFTVLAVNPVLPKFEIVEHYGSAKIARWVPVSVFLHAKRVAASH